MMDHKPIKTTDRVVLRLAHDLSIVLLREADLESAVRAALRTDAALEIVTELKGRVPRGEANAIIEDIVQAAAKMLTSEFSRVADNVEQIKDAWYQQDRK